MTIPTHPFGYVAQFGEASCAAMLPLAQLGMIRLFPEADFTADEVEHCLRSLQQALPPHAAQLVSLAYKPSNSRVTDAQLRILVDLQLLTLISQGHSAYAQEPGAIGVPLTARPHLSLVAPQDGGDRP